MPVQVDHRTFIFSTVAILGAIVLHWRFHVTVMCTCTCLCYLCLSLSTKLNEMPKRTTVRNGIRYERIPPTNPPIQKAKLATVQIQNDYRNHRHRQSKPAVRRLQTTMHRKSEKELLSKLLLQRLLQPKCERNFRTKCNRNEQISNRADSK